jgi:hypothetical protein
MLRDGDVVSLSQFPQTTAVDSRVCISPATMTSLSLFLARKRYAHVYISSQTSCSQNFILSINIILLAIHSSSAMKSSTLFVAFVVCLLSLLLGNYVSNNFNLVMSLIFYYVAQLSACGNLMALLPQTRHKIKTLELVVAACLWSSHLHLAANLDTGQPMFPCPKLRVVNIPVLPPGPVRASVIPSNKTIN